MDTTVFQSELSRLGNQFPEMQQDTALFQYIRWLNHTLEENKASFPEEYLRIVEETRRSAPEKKPFLTILTRTQGARTEMLREVFQCLASQTDMDFELLLIGHKVTDEQNQTIRNFLAEQPETIRSRTRYLQLDHGTRTTPINFGFANAYGEYVAVLDDDDLIFDHYVECFHKAAKEHPGTLLHAYVLGQYWKTVPVDETEIALCATAAPDNRYCVDFGLLQQLHANFCPLMGIAFPTVYFQKYGFILNEALTTTEDWEYIMRLAPIAGVTDISEPTAIYRWWENAENSTVVHDRQEWEDNYHYIQGLHKEMPILVPAGQNKLYTVEYDLTPPPVPFRILLKNKIREKIPTPIWKIFKFFYRTLGGKKWVG